MEAVQCKLLALFLLSLSMLVSFSLATTDVKYCGQSLSLSLSESISFLFWVFAGKSNLFEHFIVWNRNAVPCFYIRVSIIFSNRFLIIVTFIDKRCTIISINEKTYILLIMLFIIFDWKLLITDYVRLCRCTITEYELIFNLIL